MKILIAVDGSKYSEWAIDTISKLPLQNEPDIEIVQYVEIPYGMPFEEMSLDAEFNAKIKEIENEDFAKAEENINKLAKTLSATWKKTEGRVVREPNPADQIVSRAEEIGADLLVIGSRGLSQIEKLLLGSVSTKVISHAPCSVLVVKNRVESLSNLLVAVDGSEFSRDIAAFLENHVSPDAVNLSFVYVWPYAFDAPKTMVTNASTAIEESFSAQLKEKGFSTQAVFAEGDPAEEIMEQAEALSADLVVIGSRGLSGMQRFFLGSISQKVVKYIGRSVLVIK